MGSQPGVTPILSHRSLDCLWYDPFALLYRTATLAEKIDLGPKTFVLRLTGADFLLRATPGQFVMLRCSVWGADPLLPRAFSLLKVTEDFADILVKANGKASSLLEDVHPGTEFQLLGPLGNRFPVPDVDCEDWLVAGGVGLAPLLMQAKFSSEEFPETTSRLFYGGRTSTDLVLRSDIKKTGAKVTLVTEDGSEGEKGYVTDAVSKQLEEALRLGEKPRILACGPDPMLHAVSRLARRHSLTAFLSLEGEMACGIGACLVCAVPCKSKPFRYVCVDGPVFDLADMDDGYGRGST